MKTSTFAKMCGVEKRTLFHYDEIGLLKPMQIRENGYREYAMEQLGMMDMIKIFQGCGYSLAEIKQISGADAAARHQYADEAISRIDAQIRQLQQMKDYLQAKQRLLEEYRALPAGQYRIQNLSIRYDRKPVDTDFHFFSFLRDGTYSAFLLDEADDVWLCRYSGDGACQDSGTAITFFLEIPSESPDLHRRIRQALEDFRFCGRTLFFAESLPHFLLEDPNKAVIKVSVMQAEQGRRASPQP